MTTNNDLQRTMARIQKLITLSEHPNTGEAEARTFRAKAEELMREYRVQEEELIATTPDAATPQMHNMWVCYVEHERATAARNSKRVSFANHYMNLLWYACQHAGVRVSFNYDRDAEGRRGYSAALVGYEGDLRLAEMLYSAARITFAEKIAPTYLPELSKEENVYRLRSAGITRRRVAEIVYGEDTHAAHAKVAKVYKSECERRGEEPALDGRGVSAQLFREEYANAFIVTFSDRLQAAADAADATGGALVLHGRKERVDEAFYSYFPQHRPQAVAKAEKAPATKSREPRKWTGKDEAAYQRRQSAAAQAGRSAGRRAAQSVEIDRASNAQRLEA